MTSVFVNITPGMREKILERIRQAQINVLHETVAEGLLTDKEAAAELDRLLQLDVLAPQNERLQ